MGCQCGASVEQPHLFWNTLSKHVKQYYHLIEIRLLLVALDVLNGVICFENIFQDSQQSYRKWECSKCLLLIFCSRIITSEINMLSM